MRSFDREAERLAVVCQLGGVSEAKRALLIEEYRRRSLSAFAPSTLRNYHQTIERFVVWCTERGYSASPPVSPRVVAEYVDAMGGSIRASTIETRLWAISEWHRASFLPSPCRHRLVELALKSVKRTYGAAVKQAEPLSKREALEIVARLGNSRREIRDKAVIWIASDSWCRASEIVAFKVSELIRQGDGSSLLFVRRSKTDPYGQGAYAYLSGRGTEAVLEWVRLADLKSHEPLLTKHQKNGKRQPMDPATISRILKKCSGRANVSAHSTRVGGVQDAFRLGRDLSSIMVAGRWTSPEMPARYGRRILASQSAAAQVARAHEAAALPAPNGHVRGPE
ncbi:tyrosine-type recombinase/integrase [Aquicoccus sp. SCR17]|nr:tyrosine-type recombinase/integrase [Carideicomes alvinocaridis]